MTKPASTIAFAPSEVLGGKETPAASASARARRTPATRLHAVERELPRFLLQAGAEAEPPAATQTVAESAPEPAPARPPKGAQDRSAPRARASYQGELTLDAEYRATFFSQGRSYVLSLYDFSVGGVALRAAPHEVAGLQVGKKIASVQIELGCQLSMTIDLEIRLLRHFHSLQSGEQVQIGCRFANLSAQLQEKLAGMVTAASGRRRPV